MTSPSSPNPDIGKLKNALKKSMEIKKTLEKENEKLKQDIEAKNMKIEILTPLIDEYTKEKDALFQKLSEVNEKSFALEEELIKTKKILKQKEQEIQKLKTLLGNNQNDESNIQKENDDLLNFGNDNNNQNTNDDILLISTDTKKNDQNFDLLNLHEDASQQSKSENNSLFIGDFFEPSNTTSKASSSALNSNGTAFQNNEIIDLNNTGISPITATDNTKQNEEAIKSLNEQLKTMKEKLDQKQSQINSLIETQNQEKQNKNETPQKPSRNKKRISTAFSSNLTDHSP